MTPRGRILLTDGEQRSVLAAARGLVNAGYEVVVAASRRMAPAHWSRACSRRVFVPDPWRDPEVFAFRLAHILSETRCSLLLPGTDASLLAVSAHRELLMPLTALGLPSHEVVLRSLDKIALIDAAEVAGVPCPWSVTCTDPAEIIETARELGFPVVLKPATSLVYVDGHSWRQPGMVINDEEHLLARLSDFGMPAIIQRCEPATTVFSVAGVMGDGSLLASACARYTRTWPAASGSASLSVSALPPDGLLARAELLLTAIGWEGVFELELLEAADGTLKTIDLNPRLYGSLSLAIHAGANLPAVWCDHVLEGQKGRVSARPGPRYRWEEGEIRNAIRFARRGEIREALSVVRPLGDVVHAYFERTDPLPLAGWAARLPARAWADRRAGENPHRQGHSGPARPGPGDRSPRRPLPTGALEVLTDEGALAEISAEWSSMAEARGNAFVTPEWFFAWLRHYGDTARPFVPVLRESDGSVHSLLPFVVSRARFPVVAFAGANLGDYFHPVAQAGDDDLAAAAAALALESRRPEWSAIALHNVDLDASWRQTLTSSGAPLAEIEHEPEVLPFVELAGKSWQEYLTTRSRNLRSQLNRKLRRLEDEHTVSFRRTDDPARLQADMDTFFAFHDARWAARGGSSVASRRAHEFHHDFAATALRAGWLRLWFLEVDGEPVAAWYGWSLGGRYAYYLAGFEPDWSRHSVGLLLLAQTIRAAAEEGASEYDMLRGDEDYKDRFATGRRQATTVIATRPLHPLRAAAQLEVSLLRAGRRLPEGMRDGVRSAGGVLLRSLPGSRAR